MNDLSAARELRGSATKNYNGLDLIKFLCAFLIVAIHIDPFQGELSAWTSRINYWTNSYITRIAVPFYFVVSGFFLFRKMSPTDVSAAKIKDYCVKLLLLRGIWTILLFFGESYHLWYLDATVVAAVIIGLFLHFRVRFRYIALFAAVCYAIGLTGDSYFGLARHLDNIPVLRFLRFIGDAQSGVFVGFPFVLVGAYFAWHPPKLKTVTALLGFVASMLALLAEVLILRDHAPKDHNVYIFLLPAVFFLFSFAFAVELEDRPIYRELRVIGFLVYVLHMMVDWFVNMALLLAKMHLGIHLLSYRFFITLPLTLLFAILLRRLSKKHKWLKYITT